MRDIFTHQTTLDIYVYGENVGSTGEIEISITYEVTSWGRPEKGPSFSSGGEPAEGPEVDIVHVEMYNAPKRGKPVLIEAWDWVHEWAAEWVDSHVYELTAVGSLELEAQRDDAADAQR